MNFSQKFLFMAEASLLVAVGLLTPLSAQAFGSISGISYNDLNGNKIQDANEAILSGRQLELIDQTGNVIQTTTTNESGFYQFSELGAGAYIVRQVLPSNGKQTSPNFITNLTLGSVNGQWGYQDIPSLGIVGVEHWGTIAPDANGYFQTPIDLTGPTVDLNKWLNRNYQTTTLERLFNNGHTIEAEYSSESENYIDLGGEDFKLLQFHFHSPSEHNLSGSNSPLELHLVHRHQNGGLAVIGLFLEVGQENQALGSIFSNIPSIPNNGDQILGLENFDTNALFPEDSQGYFYTGSLTTPPATEGVNWFVFKTPIQVSSAQLAAYQAVADSDPNNDFLPGNRPLEPLNGRQLNEINYQLTLTDNSVIENLNFGSKSVPEPGSILSLLGLGGLFFGSKLKAHK
ncbi:carbonic anhydrase family protein [Gloeothece verrucosa]|uniref:carbonic anhydrase n=1 Tax=Gloeothece verrucosa (strain PCC 7822) TaxID=497965 RepID=E0U816_GLOV7|nr:carbonic anhydrase family protein [Gloeothece verrucosa]ADN16103.1 carbonic anhydrase [Gloeothece verrucosa PCC 7822]